MKRATHIKLAIGFGLAAFICLLALAASHLPLEVFLGSLLLAVAVPLCVPDDALSIFKPKVHVVYHHRQNFTPEQVANMREVVAHTPRPDWLERHIANLTEEARK